MKRNKTTLIITLITATILINSCKMFKKDKCNTCPKWSQLEHNQNKDNTEISI